MLTLFIGISAFTCLISGNLLGALLSTVALLFKKKLMAKSPMLITAIMGIAFVLSLSHSLVASIACLASTLYSFKKTK